MTNSTLAIKISTIARRCFAPLLVMSSITAALVGSPRCSAASPGMLEFLASGRVQHGIALIDLQHEMVVLDRHGEIHWLDRQAKQNVRQLDASYEPASVMELKNSLQSEFGKQFEVLTTQNFLVVQPRGRGTRWPDLFEQSHRAFVSYMSRRGVEIRRGRFPMIAVVFPDSSAMYAEFKRRSIDMPRVAGIYSSDSNRVMTHDGGYTPSVAQTVRHEAAHQSAFNYGVHSRVVNTPKWISEGIGQMFEPESMVSQQAGLAIRDRVNQDSMTLLIRNYDSGRSPEFALRMMELIGDDALFKGRDTVSDAYAISWAMMYYLAEREPKAFAQILQLTSRKPTYADYSRADRLRDFESVVGVNPMDFSKRVAWFLGSLQ
ncbi:hypothetical protein Pla52n_22910 [Stieleria varia]|uniref:DUF1570 domain-containing protein n=2 Tax=Stieleria varia TaxID=2528005 RepID=A0A5C6AYP7_9BACT|nr:hypothetical protein Pla52n_22910 [Stieleria varia]